MGKASSSKKVARAASIGGGRAAPGAKPWVWWLVLSVVVVAGVAGIALSRQDYREEAAPGNNLVPPVANRDHWHAAYGVYLCDEFAAPILSERDPKGIHTHGDGLIHIHPFLRSAAGNNAVLSVFADAVDMTLTDTKLALSGGKTYEEGSTKCGGKPGIVQVKVGDKVVTDNVADIKLADDQLITIAFAPKGADLPDTPSSGNLDRIDPATEELRPPGASGDDGTTATSEPEPTTSQP